MVREKLAHLPLPQIEKTVPRRKKSNVSIIYVPPEGRNEGERARKWKDECDGILLKFRTDESKVRSYYDPSLIFKIKVNQRVNGIAFSNALRSIGVSVISPSPDNTGYWVVFAESKDFDEFKKKMDSHVSEDMYSFLFAIDEIEEIPPEEKMGDGLISKPLADGELAPLDVEIWGMKHKAFIDFISGLKKIVEERGGSLDDWLPVEDICVARIKADSTLLNDVLHLREVACVDRPPRIAIETMLDSSMESIKITGAPNKQSAGILVIDSGIRANHPLFSGTVGDEICFGFPSSQDEVGHGTQVSGIALYGDIAKCLEEGKFEPDIWIFSAKVMGKDTDGFSTYSDDKLLESNLVNAVEWVVKSYSGCKIVNLSLGNEYHKMVSGKRQFCLAALVDELALKHDLLFVVSTGNCNEACQANFPDNLVDGDNDGARIIDPSTAALALTTGALWRRKDRQTLDELFDYPSPITRVGPGYNGMIKPEFAENGGGGVGDEDDVVTLNPNWIQDGRLFTLARGTSFCAPFVAYSAAKLMNRYPDASVNLVKAFMLSSSRLPRRRPGKFKTLELEGNSEESMKVLRVYGYGTTSLEEAMYSSENRVLLVAENSIKVDSLQLYYFYIPQEFLTTGEKEISVSLAFDPPTNRNRLDYLGATMEFHLFRNVDPDAIFKAYSALELEEDSEEILPSDISQFEIQMYPCNRLRKKGVHQKGIHSYVRNPDIDVEKPLILAVICKGKWVEKEYKQKYALVAKIEHRSRIDLYHIIELRNRTRVRIDMGA